MAKQNGIITIEGTIGNINFYVRKGVPVARKAGGGFNSDAIKKQPNMARVRENSSEFGHCSSVKKLFKNALHPFLLDYQDGNLHGNMMRLFTQLKDMDLTSERGKRTIFEGLKQKEGKQLMKKFAFTPQCRILPFTAQESIFNPKDYTYSFSNFTFPKEAFLTPATHATLTLGILVFENEKNFPSLFLSEPQWLEPYFQSSELVLKPKQKPNVDGLHLVFLGIQFYQEINSSLHVLKEQKFTGLVCVDVLG
jgi:hypothetical protein